MEHVDGMRYAEAKLADQGLRDRWAEAMFRFSQFVYEFCCRRASAYSLARMLHVLKPLEAESVREESREGACTRRMGRAY